MFPWQPAIVFLYFGHPQAVEVAVGIDSHRLVITQEEGNIGGVAGLQNLALTTVFCLNINPLNEVFGSHGMVHSAHTDIDGTVFNRDHRQIPFTACLYCVGLQNFHLLAAAHHGNAGIMDHTHQVAAVTADMELCFHTQFLLLNVYYHVSYFK